MSSASSGYSTFVTQKKAFVYSANILLQRCLVIYSAIKSPFLHSFCKWGSFIHLLKEVVILTSFSINCRSACVLKSIFKLLFSLHFSSVYSFRIKISEICQDPFTSFCMDKARPIIKFSFIVSDKSCKALCRVPSILWSSFMKVTEHQRILENLAVVCMLLKSSPSSCLYSLHVHNICGVGKHELVSDFLWEMDMGRSICRYRLLGLPS